jgi:hypothetical protein
LADLLWLDFQREELSLSTKRSFDLNQETTASNILGWDLTPVYGAALAPLAAPTAPVVHSQGDIAAAAVVIDVRWGKADIRGP